MNNKILFWLIFGIFIVFLIATITISKDSTEDKNFRLREIAEYEVSKADIPDGNCLDYTNYYNEVFQNKTKYPNLDVLYPHRPVNISGGIESNNDSHIYILINGYGGECIIDQYKIACIKIK